MNRVKGSYIELYFSILKQITQFLDISLKFIGVSPLIYELEFAFLLSYCTHFHQLILDAFKKSFYPQWLDCATALFSCIRSVNAQDAAIGNSNHRSIIDDVLLTMVVSLTVETVKRIGTDKDLTILFAIHQEEISVELLPALEQHPDIVDAYFSLMHQVLL